MDRERLGSGGRQGDRPSIRDQSYFDDAGHTEYGFSYALKKTLRNGMADGVLILRIIVCRQQSGSGRCQTDRQSAGEQSHIDGAEPLMYGFSYAWKRH
jgi:hypothetical protein